MKLRFQFGAWLCRLALSAALLAPGASAQNHAQERPPARQQAPPPQANRPLQSSRPPQNNRPAGTYHPQPPPPQAPRGHENRQPAYQDRGNRANNNRPQVNAPRPYDNRGNQNGRNDRPQGSYRQQAPATSRPDAQDRLRNMSPQDRNRLTENQRKFNQLPPQKQQDLIQAARNWEKLTPEQRNHLRNDVMPKWQQLPADRQRAISQRRGVLQNMPESARNRHLNDPNFTRGMSEDDRQMLQDLSHEHVGAPDRPQQ